MDCYLVTCLECFIGHASNLILAGSHLMQVGVFIAIYIYKAPYCYLFCMLLFSFGSDEPRLYQTVEVCTLHLF